MLVEQRELTYCRKTLFSVISLAILIFLIYSNSFSCSWHFDDIPNIHHNPLLHMAKLSWANIKNALFSDRNNPNIPYRPVACLSFALNYYFNRLDVFGYHLINVLIHFLASLFIFLFLYRTLTLLTSKEKWSGDPYFVGLLSAVLWAVNPIQTQAVTYIVQRMASMAAMFYIMAMYWYLQARTARSRKRSAFFFTLCLSSSALALGSKENAAMLPVSLVLCEVLILQEDPWNFLRAKWPFFASAILLTLLVGVGYLYWKNGNFLNLESWYKNRPFSWKQRLLTEPRVIVFYLSLLFYPMPNRLNIAHDFPVSTSLLEPPSTAFSMLFILMLITTALLLMRKRPLISLAILFFFLNHIIESSIFPLELVFEHRNYLPSMLLFLPVSMGLWYLYNSFASKNKKWMAAVLSAFTILLLVSMGHSTYIRNITWKNERTLWIDAVEKSPRVFRPHHNLGKYYHDIGKVERALNEYRIALGCKVVHTKDEKFITYYNLGKLYSAQKDDETALSYYKKSIDINPTFPFNYNNMANIYERRGELRQAERYLQQALTLLPTSPRIRYNLGLIYLELKRPDLAIRQLRKVVDLPQLRSVATKNLAIAYKQQGSYGTATYYLLKYLTINPNDVVARAHLAEIFLHKGLKEKYEQEMKKSVSLIKAPGDLVKLLNKIDQNNRIRNLMPEPSVIQELIRRKCIKFEEQIGKVSSYL